MALTNQFFDELTRTALNDGVVLLVVGAIILKDGKVLILRRKKGDFLEGLEELPSGKVESGENLGEALHREVAEETGLKIVDIVSFAGSFDYKSKSGKLTRQFNFVVTVERSDGVKLLEHDSYEWVPKQELDNHNISQEVKKIINTV